MVIKNGVFSNSLPDGGSEFELQCEEIKLLIMKEVGSYIITPKEIERIVGRHRGKSQTRT